MSDNRKKSAASGGTKKAASGRELKGIGDIVVDEFKRGNFDVESILTKVHKMRPGSATKAASVYWYASKAGYSIRDENAKKPRRRAASA